jgi:hypothetical protein
VLSITLVETAADAEAAEETVDVEMSDKLGDLFASWEGRRVSVEQYNVLANTLA